MSMFKAKNQVTRKLGWRKPEPAD